jgi:hypothetical protein
VVLAKPLAVDAADEAHAQTIAAYLTQREREGGVIYETGRS